MRFLDSYRGLPKSIYIIFFAQVINRFGDFVLPFLSLFLVKKLGLSYHSAGFAAMLASLSTIPGSFAGGKIADHLGRKKTYACFQAVAGVSILLCVFFKTPVAIIGLICVASFLNGGVRPIIGAIITDVLPPEKRKQGFSLSYLGINLGVSLGPIVSGFLFNHYLPLIFIGDAITSFIAVALVVLNIEETLPDASKNAGAGRDEEIETGNVFTVLVRRPKILVFLIINIFISTTYTQHTFSLPMMLDNVFGADGARNYGILMSFNAVTVVVMTMIVTQLTSKWKPLSSMAVTGFLYMVGFGMISFIHAMPLFILSAFIWTIGEILTMTSFGVYIANNTPQNFRARFNAVTSLSWGIGAMIGTSIMGLYMDAFGVPAVWPLIACLAFIGGAGMYVLKVKTEDRVAKKETDIEINA